MNATNVYSVLACRCAISGRRDGLETAVVMTMVPLCAVLALLPPALAAVAVFSLWRAWGAFLSARSLISSKRQMTVLLAFVPIMLGDSPWI